MAGRKVIEALQLHKKGFNCAQSVVLPFAEELGLDRATAKCIAEGFGAGMGGLTETCGALSGAVMVAGLKNGDGRLDDLTSKRETYKVSKELCERFKAEVGATICAEIRGKTGGKMLKTCDECVMIGAKLAEWVLMLEKNK